MRVTVIGGQRGIYGNRDGPASESLFCRPNELKRDSCGNILVLDSGNDCIRKIDTNGIVSTVCPIQRPGVWPFPLHGSVDVLGKVIFFYNGKKHQVSSDGLPAFMDSNSRHMTLLPLPNTKDFLDYHKNGLVKINQDGVISLFGESILNPHCVGVNLAGVIFVNYGHPYHTEDPHRCNKTCMRRLSYIASFDGKSWTQIMGPVVPISGFVFNHNDDMLLLRNPQHYCRRVVCDETAMLYRKTNDGTYTFVRNYSEELIQSCGSFKSFMIINNGFVSCDDDNHTVTQITLVNVWTTGKITWGGIYVFNSRFVQTKFCCKQA